MQAFHHNRFSALEKNLLGEGPDCNVAKRIENYHPAMKVCFLKARKIQLCWETDRQFFNIGWLLWIKIVDLYFIFQLYLWRDFDRDLCFFCFVALRVQVWESYAVLHMFMDF